MKKFERDLTIYNSLKENNTDAIKKVSENIDKLFEFGEK